MTANPGFGYWDVRAITGVTSRELEHWQNRGWVAPSVSGRNGSGFLAAWTADDLMSLLLIKELRRAGVELETAGRAARLVRSSPDVAAASVVVFVDGIVIGVDSPAELAAAIAGAPHAVAVDMAALRLLLTVEDVAS